MAGKEKSMEEYEKVIRDPIYGYIELTKEQRKLI